MDKSLLTYIAVGVAFLYLVTNFVNEIQSEDETLQNSEYRAKHKYDKYYTTNSIGEPLLDLSRAKPDEQAEAWRNSPLKEEFLSLYPDFELMKGFIRERTQGKPFREKMIEGIKTIEDKFLAGIIDAQEAKRRLSTLP